MARRLEGKVALVTGAGAGIGRGIALAYAGEGAKVAVNDINSQAAEAVVAEITAQGGDALSVPADVGEETAVGAMVEQVLSHFGHIDILVNNAGIASQYLVADMPVAAWDEMIRVHLRGTFLCTRFVLPHMLEQGSGRIINMASQLGQKGAREMAHYAAAKAAIIGFTKSLALEVAHQGVLVNAIAPGPIRTGIPRTDAWLQQKMKEIPLGRIGEVDDVTPTAVFLASEDSRYYVGQTLGPNGGDVML